MYHKYLKLIEQLKTLLQELTELVNEKGEGKVFKEIDFLFDEMRKSRNHFSKEEEKAAKAIFQKDITTIGVESLFCKHIVDKPFGYAGDFMATEMIYIAHSEDNHYIGLTERGKIMNAYTMQSANGKANYNRINFLIAKIRNYISNNPFSKITSLGCASCIEMREIRKQKDMPKDIHFTLADTESEAIKFSKSKYRTDNNCTFYQWSPVKMAIRDEFKDILDEQDFIYSFGFYDYLSTRAAKKLTEALWKCVKSGGSLLFVNAHLSNPTRLWMEFGGDWYLNYKDKEEMYSIVEGLKDLRDIEYHLDDFKVYQFIEAFKG